MMPVPITVGVLTHNAYAFQRFELLEQTLRSIVVAFPDARVCVLDNGSTDGTAEYVVGVHGAGSLLAGRRAIYTKAYVAEDGVHTPGRGHNQLMAMMRGRGEPGVLVVSEDDMLWRLGAADILRRFWAEAPEDLVICSGLLEPDFPWSTPREVVEAGGVRVLVRDATPHAAWTMRARHVDIVHPVSDGFGQDHEACVRLLRDGYRVAQVDLAEHMGWGVSCHGNEAIVNAKPLDREKWGL